MVYLDGVALVRQRLVPVEAKHDRNLARARGVVRAELHHARLHEDFATAPDQRESAAEIPTVATRPGIVTQSEQRPVVDVHIGVADGDLVLTVRKILEPRVRPAADA